MARRRKERNLFIKVYLDFPDHHKTVELSDRAFRELITGWCKAVPLGTDGRLTESQTFRFFSKKTVGELLAVGFLDVTENRYQLHGFPEHQTTIEEISDLRLKRAEAGRLGAAAKALAVASATASATASAEHVAEQTSGKRLAETETETEQSISGYVSNARDESRSKPVSVGAARLSKAYCDRVKLSDRGKVAMVVTNAIGAGYADAEIEAALIRLAADKRAVSMDTLRIELDGPKIAASTGRAGVTAAGCSWEDG